MDQPAQPTSPAQPPQKSNGAVTSLVLGILSIVLCLGAFSGIPALIIGIKARGKIKASQGAIAGDGMALAGIITGAIGTVFGTIALIMILSGARAAGEFGSEIRRELEAEGFQFEQIENR